MNDLGTFTEADGAVSLRYERRYPRPLGTVWAALTQPERLADWLGACEVEPRVGGRFDVFVSREAGQHVRGRVLAWDAPALLSFTWAWPNESETVVRWELSSDGPEATRLVFTQTGMIRRRIGMVLPGWHVFLERLGTLLRDSTPETEYMARFHEIRAIYADHYRLAELMAPPSACS